MRRLLPFPLLSASLLAMWLLLNQALSLGHGLLGGVLALAGGWAFALLQSRKPRIRHPLAIIRLSVLVLADIVESNIAVARIILGLGAERRTAGFVNIPLELNDPYGLAVLACIITSTPGTLWVNFDSAKGLLMIHVLDLINEDEWVRKIKGRYERPLMEIFE
jgi:multicomponent K+:H+ antiporter subunit E